jgi:D-alanine transaminase
MVSAQDRGYLFGDGGYEAIVAYGGRPFRLTDHFQRLHNTLTFLRIPFDIDKANLRGIFMEGIERAGFSDTLIYTQVTRGRAPRTHAFAKDMVPRVYAHFVAKPEVAPEHKAHGIQLITVPDIRWAHCHVKTIALLPNVLTKQQAIDAGAYDAVFMTPDEVIHEATSYNIFMVKDDVLLTPSTECRILHGITRKHVLECAAAMGMRSEERRITRSELLDADEAFLTSTTTEALAAVTVDGETIGTGRVGPHTRAIYAKFHETIPDYCE